MSRRDVTVSRTRGEIIRPVGLGGGRPRAVVDAFSGRIEYARTSHVDHKTELQEALARQGRQVNYTVLEVEGPPHDRRFTCAAVIDGEQLGVGSGRSKKAAEQEAAKEALAKVDPDVAAGRSVDASPS